MDDTSIEEIDWFPLPEVESRDHVIPERAPGPTCSYNVNPNLTTPIKAHPQLPNLSVLSINSSAPSNINDRSSVSTTPTQLDQLWTKFLDLYVTKPHPLITCNKDECTCTCHHENEVSKHQERQTETIFTTPSKLEPYPLPTSPSTTEATPPTTPQAKPTKAMERLTLQDACRHFKTSFIKNSLARQEEIKRKPRNKMLTSTYHTPSFIQRLNKITVPRQKMTYKEMYMHTKNKWDVLPEVIAKNKKSVKEKEAETNRLRVKIYQKEVLARMRRLKEKSKKMKQYL
ncbi:PREDICTED: uncharacterized protein LOC109593772 isoform X2 [Amphimedon queenslandica]|uniref:ALMS motif domain-containing protein n=1 Tax=Amphimedon queenslandica TaxID=400682 RepID=A0A1X7VK66_AMPQE|nr:PREDICTED: uncharacterized protein LOC109593772 isoform X2 [Amphimedon queenslandica]|eukprot:XP_019864422.1 PREDICTED: uncharacterized protein LOC109593772 isoform X2 [Amphimedon queenslandica]